MIRPNYIIIACMLCAHASCDKNEPKRNAFGNEKHLKMLNEIYHDLTLKVIDGIDELNLDPNVKFELDINEDLNRINLSILTSENEEEWLFYEPGDTNSLSRNLDYWDSIINPFEHDIHLGRLILDLPNATGITRISMNHGVMYLFENDDDEVNGVIWTHRNQKSILFRKISDTSIYSDAVFIYINNNFSIFENLSMQKSPGT